MERREFMAALGAVAAAASVSSAMAEEGKHVHNHPPKYKGLSEASGKCVAEGDNCLRHCFGMLSMNDTSMADCTKITYDTIAACGALQTLASVNSSYTPAFAKVVAQLCVDCKKECDKFPQYSECVAMAAACKACAEECQKVAA
ncbi:four-helix bundle copper-binding protein [Methylocystis heyeri]|uniref:Csp1 family four helix bundle copper storage protein n=1 Tax=Methylocystis heyeri TaxID=391905 RepID=A0A6B8KK95_9HYPH|nr:four-helix bundle copper-binding protein [Methylocystis heyeri]QGM47060.1 Csp1 family four helix bundle copper storage protein [Methylocystis heyeri]